MIIYNFKKCKSCGKSNAKPRFKLGGKVSRNATIWVCGSCGSHYIDYLDPIEEISPEVDSNEKANFVQSHHYDGDGRHMKHADLIGRLRHVRGTRLLDIGSGGGKFLGILESLGAEVYGLELSDSMIAYSRSQGYKVYKYPLEHEFWRSGELGRFDIITLWDVIEHVNFPVEAMKIISSLLKPGGIICISTPDRDGFYHKIGTLTYKLSGGKYPTFLDIMYSNRLFSHKQILSIDELESLSLRTGLQPIYKSVEHELSLPYKNYLKKFHMAGFIIAVLVPALKLFFRVFKIHNKINFVAQKPDIN